MSAEKVACPSCNGKGSSPAFVDYADGSGGFDPASPCSTCKGTGNITEDHAGKIRRGAVARKARIEMGITLRDRAKQLGFTAKELSDYEAGRGGLA